MIREEAIENPELETEETPKVSWFQRNKKVIIRRSLLIGGSVIGTIAMLRLLGGSEEEDSDAPWDDEVDETLEFEQVDEPED